MKRFPIVILLLLTGAIHGLVFSYSAQWGLLLSALQMSCSALLIWQLQQAQGWRQAGAWAWLFGLGTFISGTSWIYISLHDYGHMHPALASVAVILFATFMALYYALFGILLYTLSKTAAYIRHPYLHVFFLISLTASLWTGSELLRAYLFTGFPWLNLAYAHLDSPFIYWAPMIGSDGITWLAIACATGLALLIPPSRYSKKQKTIVLVSLLSLIGCSASLAFLNWGKDYGRPIHVRLIQSNVDLIEKFNPDNTEHILARQIKLAQAPSQVPLDFILFSETIVPSFASDLPASTWQDFIDIAQKKNTVIGLGIPILESSQGNTRYFNSVVSINQNDQAHNIQGNLFSQRYDKHHLVPFGEFIPTGFHWFVNAMVMPMSDFTQGASIQPLFQINDQRLAMLICYEDIFGNEVRQAIQANTHHPASLLANVSNLAWFGDSIALTQHLQMARMRAIETQRPMIRATNTGITAYISHTGKVLAAVPPSTEQLLDVTVQGRQGITPFVRWGNAFILFIMGSTLFIALILAFQHRKSH